MDVIDKLIAREGGYSNDKNDRGGETIYGIARRRHPEMWVKGPPSLAQAREFYKTKFLLAYNIDKISHPALQEQVLDYAVNSGPHLAIQKLQEVLEVTPDGVIGPETLAAYWGKDVRDLGNALAKKRIQMIARLVQKDPTQVKFLFGWVNRCLSFVV